MLEEEDVPILEGIDTARVVYFELGFGYIFRQIDIMSCNVEFIGFRRSANIDERSARLL
jgi:hypothetical protein